jgi:hypothetical protein
MKSGSKGSKKAQRETKRKEAQLARARIKQSGRVRKLPAK